MKTPKPTTLVLETIYPRGHVPGGPVKVEVLVDTKPRIGGPRFQVVAQRGEGRGTRTYHAWTLREAIQEADTVCEALAVKPAEAAA